MFGRHVYVCVLMRCRICWQDIDCGDFLPQHLSAAVADGAVPIDLVDTALTHLFLVQYRLGLFDDPSLVPYSNVPPSVVCNQAHTDLALSAAQQGIVLLKNDGTLPLSASNVKNVALIGPNGKPGGGAPWVRRQEILCTTRRGGVCVCVCARALRFLQLLPPLPCRATTTAMRRS